MSVTGVLHDMFYSIFPYEVSFIRTLGKVGHYLMWGSCLGFVACRWSCCLEAAYGGAITMNRAKIFCVVIGLC